MLFIVQDAEERPSNTASQDGSVAANERASPAVKVELDLEDAPFLEEPPAQEEAPKAEPARPAEPKPLPKGEEKKGPSLKERLRAKKKTLIFIGIAVLLLIVAAAAVTILLSSPQAPPVETGPRRVTLQEEPQPVTEPEETTFLEEWESFFIETRGSQGEIRFLRCKFSVPARSPGLHAELVTKRIPLRDAIYYYLRNKPLTFLSDKAKQKDLKDDLISVINEHLSSAKISELYFEEYVVTGDEYPAISPTPGGANGPRGETR